MNVINKLLFEAALEAEADLVELQQLGMNEHEESYERAERRYDEICNLINTFGLQEEFEIYKESKNETDKTE